MKRMAAVFVVAAWVVLCGFQQPASPQRNADKKTADAAHVNADTAQPKALPPAPVPTSNTAAETNGIESHSKQDIQSMSGTPEKSVDLVERGISIIGVVCTIALTVVGVYGIIIALRTIREMQQQREEMSKQVQATLLQLGTMNRQLTEMSQQTESLNTYVEETKKIADASVKSAEAAGKSNSQSAEFFKAGKRPWIGMIGNLSLLEQKSTKPGQYQFTVGYTLKNFGSAPALNTVVFWGHIVEDVNNYDLVKEKVVEARKSGENIVSMTGDLLLPSAEKYDTCLFGESKRPPKIVIPGCIVYRDTDGIIRHTELSFWIDFAEGEKAAFHTAWFQSAD